MSTFKAARVSIAYINDFRLPRGLFKTFAEAVGLADEPPEAEAWRAAEEILRAGIQEAMKEAVDQHTPLVQRSAEQRRAVPTRTRLNARPARWFFRRTSVRLADSTVTTPAVELSFSGATGEDVARLWRSAVSSLDLTVVTAPNIHEVEDTPKDGSGTVVLRAELGGDQGCVALNEHSGVVSDEAGGPLVDGMSGFTIVRGYQELGPAEFRRPDYQGHGWLSTDRLVREIRKPANRAAVTAAGRDLALIVTDGSNAFPLYLLEAWYQQRDHWARNEVPLPDGQVVPTPGKRVLMLDPKVMHDRQHPGKLRNGNWRAKQGNRVLAGTYAERVLPKGGRRGLLHEAIDGRKLGVPGTSSSAIVSAIKGAGVTTVDAFLITLDDAFAKTLGPYYLDATGKVHWWSSALAACKKDAAANRRSPAADKLPQIKEQMKGHSYISIDPNLLVVANFHGWTEGQTQIALALLGEKSAKGRQKRGGTDTLPPAAAVVKEGLDAYNGKSGHGYKLSTWMTKSDCQPDSGRTDAGAGTRRFLSDLASLHETIGLEVDAGTGESTADLLAHLAAITTKQRQPRNQMLKMFLPSDLPGRVAANIAEAGIAPVRPLARRPDPAVLDSPGSQLRTVRKQRKLTQQAVGDQFGVSKVIVSRWETGVSEVPAKQLSKLEGWLLEAVA